MEQQVLDAPTLSTVKIYNPIEQGIALMLAKHGHVLHTPPVVTGDPAALALAKDGRKELAKFRTALEKARKEEKAESLAYGRLVDSEAARIQAVATPLELAYDKAVTDEETRLAAIREAELQAERQRIEAHRARIQTIREVRETAALCRTAERLQQLIDGMPARLVEPFEEFQGEAEAVFSETLAALQQLHAAKVEAEFQAAELKRQQEELAQQRAEQAASELAASQARVAEEAAAQARRKAEEDELARQRAAFEQEQAEAQQRHQEQVNQLATQQREIDERKAQDAAVAPLIDYRPAPLTERDVAHCCEKAALLGVSACPDCAEINDGYQASMSAPPTLRLGQISASLGFAVTADFLRGLGFEPAGTKRAAVLYHASSWPLIKDALVNHINALPDLLAE